MPQIELRRKSRLVPASVWLRKHSKNVASQCGQDGLFEKIFEIIGTKNRWCVEFGAYDGKHLSNTWNLIANHGWHGVLIEGSEARFQGLVQNHQGNNVTCLNKYVHYEGDDSLDNLLAATAIPEDFDLLSIDIDGNDWHVWNSLTKYRPRVVCMEFNPTIPNEVYFVQDANPSINQGCSLLAQVELAKSKGYELVVTSSWDGIFVAAEYFPSFGIKDNSVDAMFDPYPYVTHLLQGYDGTFWATGNLKVQWKGIPFQPDELQLLPKSMRRY
jgi:hypothetical protein